MKREKKKIHRESHYPEVTIIDRGYPSSLFSQTFLMYLNVSSSLSFPIRIHLHKSIYKPFITYCNSLWQWSFGFSFNLPLPFVFLSCQFLFLPPTSFLDFYYLMGNILLFRETFKLLCSYHQFLQKIVGMEVVEGGGTFFPSFI